MALTLPLNLPDTKLGNQVELSVGYLVGVNKSPTSSVQQTIVYPGEQWYASVDLPILKNADGRKWTAFLLALGGRRHPFLMGDWAHPIPAGVAGTNPGLPAVDGDSQLGTTLNIKDCPADITNYFKAGDYFQLGSGLTTSLQQVVLDADTDSSGKASLEVRPGIRNSFVDGALLTLTNPKGLFRMSNNKNPWVETPGTNYAISFEAEEYIV